MRILFVFLGLLALEGVGLLGHPTPRHAAGAGGPAGSPTAPPPTATPDCGLAWRIVPGPQPVYPDYSHLYNVAVLTPQDIWTVGAYSYVTQTYPLVEHWDGATWQIVPSPGVGTRSALVAIAALAPDNIWAAGKSYNDADGDRTLIEHWNGQSWQIVPSPNPNSRTVALRSMAAAGPADIWAVGKYVDPTLGGQTLTLHWDGQSWQIVPSPNGNGLNDLYTVAATAANDVWAVGLWNDQAGNHTLTLHWDGQSWAIVPSPDPDPTGSALNGVTALAINDAWVVGNTHFGNLTMRWDGAAWQVVPSPRPPGTPGAYLLAAAASAPNDVWAFGYAVSGGYGPAVALHWDGRSWNLAMPPDPPSGNQYIFNGGAALWDGSAWAVGSNFYSGIIPKTLSMQYTDPCLTPSPTATLTATPTIPPSATPTACALTFSDVPPSQPFYPYIRCLACRGIVSGYADGTFRPGANVTRGQLAKILAGAAAFQDGIPSTQQTFADVPPSAPFWLWAERLAGHGAISGYACGGPGEPCDGQQRPYFRPGAPATRGQIAKIAALAAAISDPVPPAQQTFADVPPGNPFWRWIEQLAGRGVISGYPCGGPGEPCDGQQRPYFRWGANTTRGQMSKIAAQTFFPGCQTPTKR